MAKPTTVRVPEELLNEIDQLVKENDLDRSTYLREVLQKGFLLDKQERALKGYTTGKLTLMELSRNLNCDPWEILSLLQYKNEHLNVLLEDWLDSADLGFAFD
ncbi:MAG: ribbon-helix-helix protein, CopG family [Deltaproteobacteria bacterium]|nr:ribbon-helix-helix protein, CopG family [Deltaproteobacteria bacterium]